MTIHEVDAPDTSELDAERRKLDEWLRRLRGMAPPSVKSMEFKWDASPPGPLFAPELYGIGPSNPLLFKNGVAVHTGTVVPALEDELPKLIAPHAWGTEKQLPSFTPKSLPVSDIFEFCRRR